MDKYLDLPAHKQVTSAFQALPSLFDLRSYSKPFQDLLKMGAATSKTILITKPAQSGKDRSVTNRIKEDQLTCTLFGMTPKITIIFHGLTKSLGGQKSSRMAEDGETFDKSKILLWNSDGNKDTYTETGIKNSNCSAKELFTDIIISEMKYILCCDVKRRWDAVRDLCELANNYCVKRSDFPGFRIIVDEADARMDTWRSFEAFAATSASIHEIVLVTATPDTIISRYTQIKVAAEIKPIDPEYYVGSADQTFIHHDLCHSSAIEYVETLFELPEVSSRFTPGSRWFVPADIDRESHNDVCDYFIKKGANVVVINGIDKKIFLNDGKHYDISDEIASGSLELGQIIKNYWSADPRLQSAAFVITGNLCIERGISFQDSREGIFLFDTAIISNITDKDKAYQTLSRMFGNIKKVRGDHKGVIFTTSTMEKKIREQEMLAIKLNEVALTRSDQMVTKDDVKRIKKGKSITDFLKKISYVRDTFTEVQTIAREYWNKELETRNRETRNGLPIAPMTLREKFFDAEKKTFDNPTEEYLLNRMWGLNEDEIGCRAYPIQGNKWCIYGYLKEIPVASVDDILSVPKKRKAPRVASE